MSPMINERRLLYRHGMLFLLMTALVGVLMMTPVPHGPKWMQAHLAGIVTGLLLISFGALWPEVRLSDVQRRRALWMGLIAAWLGWVSNVYVAIVNLPGPGSDPGRQPDAPWQLFVLLAILAVVIPTTLGSFYLVWHGLRGDESANNPAPRVV